MAFETEGTVHKVFDTESKTDSFKAREFVIKLEGQYPQFIKFQLTQDRCDLMDHHKEGDLIKVHFDLRGREWNEKYFTNLNAWKIEKAQSQDEAPSAGNQGFDAISEPDFELNTSNGNGNSEEFDDLPF
jgi:hypothetical protein